MSVCVDRPLRTTLADVVSLLQKCDVPHALIGGLAVSARGHSRLTADVDLIVAIDTQRAIELAAALADTRFQPLFSEVQEVIERAFILPLIHRDTKVKVDLAIGVSGFERQAVARAESCNVLGTDVAVATAEDLIIMKALAGRPRDEQDLRGMVIAQGAQLDWEYCESTASALGEALGSDLAVRIRALREQSF